jgi:hypothetical protein
VVRLAGGLVIGLVIGFTVAWVAMAVYELATGQLTHSIVPGPMPIVPKHPWIGP